MPGLNPGMTLGQDLLAVCRAAAFTIVTLGLLLLNSPMPSFLQTRLSGEAPLETVFWRDMLAIGTGVNIAAGGAAFAMFAGDWPPALALTVSLLPVPWNLFLFFALWRSAEREGGPPAVTAKVIGTLWLIVMLVV